MVCLRSLEYDTSLPLLCVCEHASLCAYDVTGHEQKDLGRISQGLDVSLFQCFSVKSNVLHARRTTWARPACSISNDLLCAEKAVRYRHTRINTRIHDLLRVSKIKNAYIFLFLIKPFSCESEPLSTFFASFKTLGPF